MTSVHPIRSLSFFKLEGAGNDFVAFDNRERSIPEGPKREALIRILCDRQTGVGTDGALILEPPSDPAAADVRMRYHNRDGMEAEMCGNGARCLALFAHYLGAGPDRGMRIETLPGIQRADVFEDGLVRLDLVDVPPLRHHSGVETDGWTGDVDFVRVGNPHVVVWVEDLDATPVDSVGPALRHHAAFAPAGVNVNFAVIDRGGQSSGLSSEAGSTGGSRVRVRTYERGVERETLACGTGSVATAISAVLAGNARAPVAVRVRGGVDLIIDFQVTPERGARGVTLTGPARLLFRAETRWDPETGYAFIV